MLKQIPTSYCSKREERIKRRLATAALLGLLALSSSVLADNLQVIPPTPLGSMVPCPAGSQLLIYSGTNAGSTQAGMNCVPIRADAQGDVAASGFVQVGNSTAICNATLAGAIRFNATNHAFEGCNGTGWQAIGGGGGLTMVVGGCQTSWSSCPAGYRATSYFSPGTYNCCDRCGNPSWKYTVCSQ